MSRIEPRAAEWLRQQVDELGALRNASVRDPQFKAWRQNTLTFIQRIWSGDSSKSERFRRIPFSPPSTRVDARQTREQYERGCGEALEYLNNLLAVLGEERVSPGTVRSVPAASETFEGDFPVVELGANAAPDLSGNPDALTPPALPPGMMGEAADLELPGSPAAQAAPRSTGPSRLPSSAIREVKPEGLPEDFRGATPLDDALSAGRDPAPPEAAAESRISVRGSAEASPAASETPRVNPLADILGPDRKAESPAPKSARGGRARKGGKNRLKEMLGLASLEVGDTAEPAAARPAPQAPVPAPPPPTAPSPPPPVEPAPEHWTMPEFMTPGESVMPLTAEDVEPAQPAAADSTAGEVWRDAPTPAEVWHDAPSAFASASTWSSEASRHAAEPLFEPVGEPVSEPVADASVGPETAVDARDAARVTAEFLRNSPVLSSLPRAVPRRGTQAGSENSQAVPSRESAASRMLAIAAEVDALGVPEGHRARTRAALMDLARQLDQPEVSWDVLRDAVHLVMEFPPVARRALPLLLPFLDIAA